MPKSRTDPLVFSSRVRVSRPGGATVVRLVRQPATIHIVIPGRRGGAGVAREVLPRLQGLHPALRVIGVLHRTCPRAVGFLQLAREEEFVRHARVVRQSGLPHAPQYIVIISRDLN